MLFKSYQIFIFNEKSGKKRTITLYSAHIICVLIPIIALATTTFFFGKHFFESKNIYAQYKSSQEELQNNKQEVLALIAELSVLRDEIADIREYDSQLKLMLGQIDTEEQSAIGGTSVEHFDIAELPLHRQELMGQQVRNFINELKEETKLEQVTQQTLLSHFNEQAKNLAATPSIWPAKGYLSSRFGYRSSPFTGARTLHRGLDIAGPKGTPIIAPGDATVLSAKRNGAYGLTINLDHGNGIITRYAHLSKMKVKKGEKVKRGDIIGDMGSTGRSTGSHLHYEVIVNGAHVNPMAYILNN